MMLLNPLGPHAPSYEAWVIYNFMSLCLAYVGGPGAVEIKMAGVVLLPSWVAGTCCLPPMPVNGRFIRLVKQGALQFVLAKPILAALTLILYTTGHYEEGNWAPNNGCAARGRAAGGPGAAPAAPRAEGRLPQPEGDAGGCAGRSPHSALLPSSA